MVVKHFLFQTIIPNFQMECSVQFTFKLEIKATYIKTKCFCTYFTDGCVIMQSNFRQINTIKKKYQYNEPSIQHIAKESVISFKHCLLHLRISPRNLRCEFKCRNAEIYTCDFFI
jgi:hypothetical protein